MILASNEACSICSEANCDASVCRSLQSIEPSMKNFALPWADQENCHARSLLRRSQYSVLWHGRWSIFLHTFRYAIAYSSEAGSRSSTTHAMIIWAPKHLCTDVRLSEDGNIVRVGKRFGKICKSGYGHQMYMAVDQSGADIFLATIDEQAAMLLRQQVDRGAGRNQAASIYIARPAKPSTNPVGIGQASAPIFALC
ncbi:hypothetical protein KC356_g9 [Hortaea werneckii]|nr:hypothetical protein KC356_g9 [Hortaea werneckii]